MIDALGHPQHVLVLGGTSEIALAAVRRWVSGGPLTVSLAARPGPRRDAARTELEELGARVVALDFDAEDVDSHPAVVRRAAEQGDLDVVLVMADGTEPGEWAGALWYPLWDSGWTIDHSVRTVGEVLAQAAADLRVATGMLDEGAAGLIDPPARRQQA